MDLLPLAVTGGWASGISAYATVLILGLIGRTGVADVPDVLQRTDVLVVFGVLTAVEFVADKIMWLDSAWDSVHTVVRPLVAAGLGALLAGEAGTVPEAAVAALMAGLALATHSTKAGLRLAVNASPEPASNVAVSAAEDVTLAGVLLLATQAPWLAAGLAILLLVGGIGLVVWLVGRVRRGGRRLWARVTGTGHPVGGPPPPSDP
jgi:hypothetical protein